MLLPPILLALSACGASGPTPRTVNVNLATEIEAKLRAVPCVGSMDHGERHYVFRSKPSLLAFLFTFGTSNRWFDYRTVDIGYYQAGFEEFRARSIRHNGIVEMPYDPDDREYNVVFGDYDIPTHTGSLWACGPNMGGSPDVKIVVR